MYDYVRTYRTARAFFSVMETICYLTLVGAVILFGVGLSQLGGSNPAVGVGLVALSIGVAFASFIGVAMSQVSRAVVDNAETNREMLEIARAGAGLAKGWTAPSSSALPLNRSGGEVAQDGGSLADYVAARTGTAARNRAQFAPARILITTHNGRTIHQEGWVFSVDRIDRNFFSLDEAKAASDNLDKA